MYAPRISMDYDEGKALEKYFSNLGGGVQQLSRSLTYHVQLLQEGGWRGRGAQAFYTEMNDVILPAVDRLAKALTEAHHAMSLIATRFQEAEQEAGALFTGVNGGKEGDGPSPKPTTTLPAQDGVSGAPNDSGSGNTRPNLAEQFAEFQRTRPDYSDNPRIDYYGTRITQREAQLLDELNIFQRLQANSIKNDALSRAERFLTDLGLPSNEIHNGIGDAFRHAYWSARMTQAFGEEWTRNFTTAHEMNPENDPTKFKEEFMDLHNNALGIRIARENPNASPDQLAQLIAQALKKGEGVYIIQPDGTHAYTDQHSAAERLTVPPPASSPYRR